MRKMVLFAFLISATFSTAFGQRPTPTPAPFLMEIKDVFTISGYGTVISGQIERGKIKVADTVEVVGIKPTKAATVTKIESSRKLVQEAEAGTTVGLTLRGIEKTDIVRGQVIAAPGSIKPYTKFKAVFDLRPSHDRGRNTPIFTGYSPQLFFRSVGFSAKVTLTGGKESAMPGDKNIVVDVELTEPAAVAKGTKFTITDNGREVGSGTITAVIDK